jgi:hypothetical protein
MAREGFETKALLRRRGPPSGIECHTEHLMQRHGSPCIGLGQGRALRRSQAEGGESGGLGEPTSTRHPEPPTRCLVSECVGMD